MWSSPEAQKENLSMKDLEEGSAYDIHVNKIRALAGRPNSYLHSVVCHSQSKTLEDTIKHASDYRRKQHDLVLLKENIRLFGNQADLNKKSTKRIEHLQSAYKIKSLRKDKIRRDNSIIAQTNQQMVMRISNVKAVISKSQCIKHSDSILSHSKHLSKFKNFMIRKNSQGLPSEIGLKEIKKSKNFLRPFPKIDNKEKILNGDVKNKFLLSKSYQLH